MEVTAFAHNHGSWREAPGGAIAAAVVATNCEYWSEAAELWHDLALWPGAVPAAAPCAAEAALRSGDFGVADQMIARSDISGEARVWLDGLAAEAAPIREARRALFTEILDEAEPQTVSLERLFALALYRDAVLTVAQDSEISNRETRTFLIRAHHGLGEHDKVDRIATGSALTDEIALLVARSRELRERRGIALGEHRAIFAARHPAAPLIDWPANW